jgi:capsular exopolysaccharide synthesis family protein
MLPSHEAAAEMSKDYPEPAGEAGSAAQADERGGQYPYGYPGQPVVASSPLKFYIDVLRRRIWFVVPVVLASLTIGALRAFREPSYYTASARVLVERNTPRVPGLEGVAQDVSFWDADFYKTRAELVRTRAILDVAMQNPAISNMFPAATVVGGTSGLAGMKRSVVSLLGAVPAPPPPAWERLGGEVQAEHEKGTHFIRISSTGADPARAATLVNAVAGAFAGYHAAQRREVLGDAFVFLEEEKRRQEQNLLQAQRELQEFRDKATHIALDGTEKEQPALARLNDISAKLTQVQLERLDVASSLDTLRKMTADVGGASGDDIRKILSLWVVREDSVLADTYKKVVDARDEEGRLAAVYGAEHPAMVAAAGARARQEDLLRDVLGQKIDSLAGRERLLTSREQALSAEQESQRREALQLAKEVFAFQQLQNNVRRFQKLHEAIADRLREVDVSTGFVRTNARIVQDARPPAVPSGPNRGRMVVIALLAGLALGIGAALAFEHVDDTIKTPEDVKSRLSLPMLGFVPRIEARDEPGASKRDRRPGLVVVEEPISSAAEAYRNIRTRLIFALPAGERKVLGVTSCNPGEGKTTTAVNMATAMAAAGKKVLLIDADIHRPMVHRCFRRGADPGLTNILAGGMPFAEAVWRYRFPDDVPGNGTLDIVMAGPESPNPAELLSSSAMRRLLAESREAYDWVFVDIPPVLFVSDASILSALCEGVILVVRAGRNNRSSLSRAAEQLSEIKVNIVGSVLNDVVLSRVGRYMSDYAYYGYSRYSRQYHKSYYDRGDRETRNAPSDGRREGTK